VQQCVHCRTRPATLQCHTCPVGPDSTGAHFNSATLLPGIARLLCLPCGMVPMTPPPFITPRSDFYSPSPQIESHTDHVTDVCTCEFRGLRIPSRRHRRSSAVRGATSRPRRTFACAGSAPSAVFQQTPPNATPEHRLAASR
jgi:hypothetical protein